MNERDLQDAALRLKRYQQFLRESKWEEARSEWERTPDGMMGEPSILAQMDVLANHLPAMIAAGQFEAAHRAVLSMRHDLPGYREDELADFETRLVQPLDQLNRIDQLVSRHRFQEALDELARLHGGDSPWMVENYDTRIQRITQKAAEDDTGAVPQNYVTALPPADLEGHRRTAPSPPPPRARRTGRALLLAALLPALLATSVLLWHYVLGPRLFPTPGTPADIPEKPLPFEPPQPLPGQPDREKLPMAVSDDFSGLEAFTLVDTPGRRTALIPLARLLENDRNITAGFSPGTLQVRSAEDGNCSVALAGEEVRVTLAPPSSGRPQTGVGRAVFHYRIAPDAPAKSSETNMWARVHLKVVWAPKIASEIIAATTLSGQCRIPSTLLAPAGMELTFHHPWSYAVSDRGEWLPAGKASGDFVVPVPPVWAGAPQRIFLRGKASFHGEDFELETSCLVYGAEFQIVKENCPAGREVVVYERDMRGTRFPFELELHQPGSWLADTSRAEGRVSVESADDGRAVKVSPLKPFNGEVVLKGRAFYKLPRTETRIDVNVTVTMNFTGAPAEKPEPPGKEPLPPPPTQPTPPAQPILAGFFTAPGGSPIQVNLPAAEFHPGGWGGGARQATVACTPPEALKDLAVDRDMVSFRVRGPAIVQIDPPRPETPGSSSPDKRFFVVVFSERGALAADNLQEFGALKNYRDAEEFKTRVLEEAAQTGGTLPDSLLAPLATSWLALHLELLDRADDAGLLRGQGTKRAIRERLEKIAILIGDGDR